MKLTESQFTKLKETYAKYILDGMDGDDLYLMAHDYLMDEYDKCSQEEIKNEILDLYDQERLDDFMEEAVA